MIRLRAGFGRHDSFAGRGLLWRIGNGPASEVRATRAASSSGLVVAVAVAVLAACGGTASKSTAPTPVTTVQSPSTAVSPGAAAATAARGLASRDEVALRLTASLLGAAGVQAALGLPTQPAEEPAGPKAVVQGPLSEQGLLSVLPSAALYKPIYDRAGGGIGANVLYHAATPKLDIDILTAKFASRSGGKSFVEQAAAIATTLAQGKAIPHPEMGLGVLPASLDEVIRVPPGALTDPNDETIITDILYGDGVDYLMTLVGPPGTMTDAQVIALAEAQDAKYHTLKATIGA